MKGTWNGPPGYVPELGNMTEGQSIDIADQEFALKLKTQGWFRPSPDEDMPRIPKPRKSGGE